MRWASLHLSEHPDFGTVHPTCMIQAPGQSLKIDHPVIEEIEKRWSPAIYSPRAIAPEDLVRILEGARWAPSSANEQPWSYLVARKEDTEGFARMLSCLVPGNVAWAQHAPVLLLSVARKNSDYNGKPNRYAWHDTGISLGFLMLEASGQGILAHGMAGFDAEKAREVFAIPETHDPVAAVALGYPGEEAGAPAELVKRNQRRGRRPLNQFVFAARFGEVSPLVSGK